MPIKIIGIVKKIRKNQITNFNMYACIWMVKYTFIYTSTHPRVKKCHLPIPVLITHGSKLAEFS